MKRIALSLALLVTVAAAAAPSAAAQGLRYLYRTGGYWALGFSGGNFTLACDSGCPGNKLSSSGATLNLGIHVSSRVRLELGAQYQSNRDSSSNAFGGSVGAAVYLLGGLHVRGAATYLRTSVESGAGTFEGSGGPGFLIGAGYDLRLGQRFALTPYVNYTSGSISKLTRTAPGGATSTTAGTLHGLNFGLALSAMRGDWECVTAAGERVRVTPRHRARALACLDEYVARYGRRPAALKY